MSAPLPRRLPSCSIVLVLGPPSEPLPAALSWALGELEADPDVELVVVDDSGPEELKERLAGLTGALRVLHSARPLGTRAAMAAGVRLARGPAIALVVPDARPAVGKLAPLVAAFEGDPGIGVVHAGTGPSGQSPLVVLRRAAIDSLGGPDVLNDRSTEHHLLAPVSERGPLLPAVVAAKLSAACWRTLAVESDLADRGIVLWRRDPAPSRRAPALVWNPHRRPATVRRGLNVVGLFDAACGVGDAARRYTEALSAGGLGVATFNFGDHASPAVAWDRHGDGELTYDTNLLIVPPEALASLAVHAGRELWRGRRSIGMWFWELETLSPAIEQATGFVHEFWAASHFLQAAFSAHTDRPVVYVPLPVPRREGAPRLSRADLGMPEDFVFLTSFDFGSVALRKNSLGVVRAFVRAFAPGEGPVLVVKTLNAAWDPLGWAELSAAVGSRRDVIVLDGYVSDEVVSAMVGSCDCYVSLHRSEGFGLSLAEAMAWGRPVIATGYSGNLDYMNDDNSFLVPYDLVAVPESLADCYPPGSHWAEPDLDTAAGLMRTVFDERALAQARAARGRADIRRTNSAAATAHAVHERLGTLADAAHHAPVLG